MTVLAIIFMISALALVTSLAGWCYYKVLFKPKQTSGDGDN